jgi:hypothetical protein
MSTDRFRLSVPSEWRSRIEEFIARETLGWELTEPPGGDVSVVAAEPKSECTSELLHPGGRISCAAALAMADGHDQPRAVVGRLMDLLEIRIHSCQLGCFR